MTQLVNFDTREDLERAINKEIDLLEAERELLLDRPVFDDTGLNINLTYPNSKEFKFETGLNRINLDKERERDILSGRGFIISTHQPIQKEIKAENGIFSPRYGQTLSDTNPFIDRYRCKEGCTRGRIHNGTTCPVCGTKVKYVDDNYACFGWMVLKDEWLIHPNLYKTLESLIGPQRLINILDIIEEKDEDGHTIEKPNTDARKGAPHRKEKDKNEPYYGRGMVYFREHFEEICDYYLSIASNKSTKREYYNDIMNNKDILFTQSIPVYTTHLRPYDASDKKKLTFEGTNALYNMMSKLVTQLNDTSLKIFRKTKERGRYLFELQTEWNKLYREIDNILSGKKGNVRLLASARFNFSSRDVIVQNPNLRVDQVTLPYWCLVELLQQRIINVLTKTYNMSYNDAYNKWYQANIERDDTIVKIIEALMFVNPKGLPIIINRNPSISRGSLLQMFCVGMTFTYTMALPLQILPLLAAD